MSPLLSSVIHSVATDNLGANWVFSPASYAEAVQSLLVCAEGRVADELTTALGWPATGWGDNLTGARQAHAGLDESFNCVLFSSEYRDALQQGIVSLLQWLSTDTVSFGTPDEAIAMVNQLVEAKTRGRIRDLANRDNVTALTKAIILNCVYFKRDWAHPLAKHWRELTFTNADGTAPLFTPLAHETYYRYHEDPLFDLVELPYKDSTVACYLFVPTARGGVFDILNGFSAHFARIKEVKRDLCVHLKMPAFKVESMHGLNAATRAAGVKAAFEWSKEWGLIDWTKLRPDAVIAVTDIVQKAFIEVTEKGTEAAAATGIMMSISGCYMPRGEPPPPKVITADHPFVFCLADTQHPDAPLFVGAVNRV